MRQHILTTALAAAVTVLAYGQNLNPTVEVTNAYEGEASSIVKPFQQMAVPDSVLTFNLDFDYSVFENPYKGSYEFRPYYVQLRPAAKPSTEERFYLRLGAGYTLHPELDLVWTPVRKERFQLNVYALHHSYFGNYHQIGVPDMDPEVSVLKPTGQKAKGFLADSKAGVNGTYSWDGGLATFNVNYRNRMADDALVSRKMGGVEADARVRSLPGNDPHFLYDAALRYHYFDFKDDFSESLFGLDGTFGPVLGENHRIVADVDMTIARYRSTPEGAGYAGYTGALSLTPKYVFNMDRWSFSLGARLSTFIYSDGFNQILDEHRHKPGRIFPDVHVDYHLLDDQLILQGAATGGDHLQAMSDFFLSRPFVLTDAYSHSLERIRAMIGARGQIANRFRFDLQGGYARWSHALVDGFAVADEAYLPTLYDDSFHLLFAQLDYGWKSESVTVDGKLAYRWARVQEDGALAPAAFTGFLRPAYNWGERFRIGMDASWSTGRKAVFAEKDFRVPGWVDLGLFAEYRFTHQFGFWAKGGNLLNQAVQRMPLHAEAGIYGTVGILLNF